MARSLLEQGWYEPQQSSDIWALGLLMLAVVGGVIPDEHWDLQNCPAFVKECEECCPNSSQGCPNEACPSEACSIQASLAPTEQSLEPPSEQPSPPEQRLVAPLEQYKSSQPAHHMHLDT